MNLKWMPMIFLALPACEARNLYVAHDTVVGVNAMVNQSRQEGQLMIGYDRDFVTIVPKSVEKNSDEPDPFKRERDVMSLISCSYLKIDGVNLDRYVDISVSGKAAEEYAKNHTINGSGQASSEINDCEFVEGS